MGGNKGPPQKNGEGGGNKKDGGNDKKSGNEKKDYGKKGRKLAGHEHHGDDHKNDHGKAGDKKPEKAGEKKPGYGKEGGDKAPSAELKAAMEACKKNELCRALMECKMKHKESGGKGHDDKEVCVKEMAACAGDETCKGLHMKVQMLMKKEGGDKKEGGYGGKSDDGKKDDGKDYGKKDDGKDYGKKDDGNKGPPQKKGEGGYKKNDGSDKKGGKPGSGRKLHQHGAHPPKKEEQKDGDKKPEKDGDKKPGKDGDKKPGYGKEGGDKAPSAELKAAMEACKKNELCRALMECKMEHKESG